MKNVKKISIRISEDLYEKLEDYANKRNITISEAIRKILLEKLGDSLPKKRWKYYYIYKAPTSILNRAVKYLNERHNEHIIVGFLRELYDTYKKALKYCEDENEIKICKHLYNDVRKTLCNKITNKELRKIYENYFKDFK